MFNQFEKKKKIKLAVLGHHTHVHLTTGIIFTVFFISKEVCRLQWGPLQ